jgi:hypothetical protein
MCRFSYSNGYNRQAVLHTPSVGMTFGFLIYSLDRPTSYWAHPIIRKGTKIKKQPPSMSKRKNVIN